MLTQALAKVRGEPFAQCYYWWLDLAMVEALRDQIVRAAQSLAEISLYDGDPAAAARAARMGLAADSCAEQLWRILMRAEHAAGNLAGVREAWTRCRQTVSEVAADGEPDAETAAVYDALVAP
jgi:DNA-binding SARP family transcriptional activator